MKRLVAGFLVFAVAFVAVIWAVVHNTDTPQAHLRKAGQHFGAAARELKKAEKALTPNADMTENEIIEALWNFPQDGIAAAMVNLDAEKVTRFWDVWVAPLGVHKDAYVRKDMYRMVAGNFSAAYLAAVTSAIVDKGAEHAVKVQYAFGHYWIARDESWPVVENDPYGVILVEQEDAVERGIRLLIEQERFEEALHATEVLSPATTVAIDKLRILGRGAVYTLIRDGKYDAVLNVNNWFGGIALRGIAEEVFSDLFVGAKIDTAGIDSLVNYKHFGISQEEAASLVHDGAIRRLRVIWAMSNEDVGTLVDLFVRYGVHLDDELRDAATYQLAYTLHLTRVKDQDMFLSYARKLQTVFALPSGAELVRRMQEQASGDSQMACLLCENRRDARLGFVVGIATLVNRL